MKKIITALALMTLITGCNKQTATPVPPPSTNNIVSNPILNSQEQSLIGYWVVDSVAMYSSAGSRIYCTINTNTVSCKLDLQSCYFTNTTSGDWKNSNNGMNCTINNLQWKAPDTGYLNLAGTIYQISFFTSTKMILIWGYSGGESRYYLRK